MRTPGSSIRSPLFMLSLGTLVGLSLSLSIASCGSESSPTSGTTPVSSPNSGTNVVTGIMPTAATTARTATPSDIISFASLFHWLTTIDSAYAVSKGHVEILGTTIQANPMGGGRFELMGVPDGPVTLEVITPDQETGRITLTLPPGGGALVDLGHVTVRRGNANAQYLPSHKNTFYPAFLQARGAVSGLSQAFSNTPTDDICREFIVAGVHFCFDRDTRFNPPLSAHSFNNTSVDNKVADILAEPYGDATSNVFRARRIQRNNGSSSANDNTVQAIAPITDLGSNTITLFGAPLITDNDPNTPDLPNNHAITFDTTRARLNPRGLEQNLLRGLVVQIDTPKQNRTGPAVTTNQSGQHVAEADRVKLVRFGNPDCANGELIRVTGTVFSPNSSTFTFGLTTASGSVFVQADPATRYDEPLTDFSSLTVDRVIEVYALPPQRVGGPLRALLIDVAAAPGEIEVRGVISSLNTSTHTFVVSGLTLCYDCGGTTTEFVGVTSTTLANGQFVEVLGTAPNGGISTALRVELEADPRPSSCSDGGGRDDD